MNKFKKGPAFPILPLWLTVHFSGLNLRCMYGLPTFSSDHTYIPDLKDTWTKDSPAPPEGNVP
jgi:hypothetical protein